MQHWVDQEFNGHDFTEADLAELRTERVVFTDCDFNGADLAGSVHDGSAFRNCRFRRTNLWHSTFRFCSFLGSVFEECRIRPITFEEVDFSLAVLAGEDESASIRFFERCGPGLQWRFARTLACQLLMRQTLK